MHAVLRVDPQLRGTVFINDLIDAGGAVALFRGSVGLQVHGDGNSIILQGQVARLVFLMVGVRDEH